MAGLLGFNLWGNKTGEAAAQTETVYVGQTADTSGELQLTPHTTAGVELVAAALAQGYTAEYLLSKDKVVDFIAALDGCKDNYHVNVSLFRLQQIIAEYEIFDKVMFGGTHPYGMDW